MPDVKLRVLSHENFSEVSRFEHVVFLGTFNADKHRQKIENWLLRLDLTGTALVVSDNCSEDGTVEWLLPLLQKVTQPSILVQTLSNIGGYGNLANIVDALNGAKWITTLHQDDLYDRGHVQNHRRILMESGSELGMVCTEPRSVDAKGKVIPFPRGQWFLKDADIPTLFLSHLKNHSFPFSGATFAHEGLKKFEIPWHGIAFPDTEIVMKMIVEFEVKFTQESTVAYFENPSSESHSLSEAQRDFGAFFALLRVFAHPNFTKLLAMVEPEDLAAFLEGLRGGIGSRFKDPAFADLMSHAAIELAAEHLGVTPAVADALTYGYDSVGDRKVLAILASLGAKLDGVVGDDPHVSTPSSSSASFLRRTAIWLGRLIPSAIRRPMLVFFLSSPFGKKRFSQWDFEWRKR